MTQPGQPPPGQPAQPPFTNSLASSQTGWRSEEDYLLARLAVGLGLLDQRVIQEALRAQGQAITSGQALSLSQVLVREGRLTPQALLQVKAELARSLRTCPGCGQARYLAAGRDPRVEPCPRCGAAIPVPPASQSLSASAVAQREAAFRASGTARFRFRDPLAAPEGGPRLFGEFVLEQELARGGMGAVYRARHQPTGQVYALKVLLAGERATEAQVHRFQRELRAQTELDHPNIVRVHHSGEWEGVLYCAMDLVEGSDLAKALPGLGLRERVALLARVARAIQHAHEHGYVHRDLKPGNVLVGLDGEPKVTDFGLAKQLGGETRLTREGSVLGTPYYMAPEQATGQVDKMGPRSDVWALGVLLYEAIADTLPFQAATAIELYRKICEERPAPLSDFGQTSPELQTIVSRALEKRPEDRYPSAETLAEDLERWLRGESPHMSQLSSAVRLARKMGQHRRSIGFVAGVAGLGLVALLGVIAVSSWILAGQRREKALLERRGAMVETAALLERLAQASGSAQDPAALDAALAQAAGLLAAEGVEPELRAALQGEERALGERRRAALLARGQLGLAARDRSGARRALECAEQAGEAGGALRALALRRLGDEAGLKAHLERSRDRDPLLLAELALPGDPAAALLALGKDDPPDAPPSRHLLRGRALLGAGKADDAAKAFARARERGGRAALLGEAEAWRQAGRPAPAAAALEAALALDPADLEAARTLLLVQLGRGRPDLAARALGAALEALGKAPPPELAALHLRARDLLLEEGAPAELLALAPRSAEARLRLAERADVGPVTTAWEPAVAARGDDPRPLAARARARARRGDAAGAKADLASLEAVLTEAPADVGPGPLLARTLRDAGWARLALNDAQGAAELALPAARGLPEDLDAALLLLRAAPALAHPTASGAATAGAEAVLRRELGSLEGPLGRGLCLARLARLRGSPELAALARPLLEARLAGDPALEDGVAVELTGGGAPQGPPWSAVLPSAAPAPVLADAERAELEQETQRLRLIPRERDDESVEGLKKVLTRHPGYVPALWEVASRSSRSTVGDLRVWTTYFPFLGRTPTSAFWVLFRARTDLRREHSLVPAPPGQIVAEVEREAPGSLGAEGLWIMDRYFGLLAEDGEKPAWTRIGHEALLERLDPLLVARPEAAWLLWVRAHVVELAGPRGRCDRDLVVLRELARTDVGVDGTPPTAHALLYETWILAPGRPERALQCWERLPSLLPMSDKELARFKQWLDEEPLLEAIRNAPAFKRTRERLKSG